MVGDQHADTALGQKLDDALNVNHGNRVNAGEGLVKQYETRVGRQRTGDFHAAALTSRQGGRGALQNVTNLQIGHQLVQLAIYFCTAQAFAIVVTLQFQYSADVFLDRQFAENRGFLRQIRQAVA